MGLVLFDSSTPGFNRVLVLVQDLLVESLLKVTTPLEDVRCCVQCIYIKKEKIKLVFYWFIFFITFYAT